MKRLWVVLGMALASGGGAAYLAAGYLEPVLKATPETDDPPRGQPSPGTTAAAWSKA